MKTIHKYPIPVDTFITLEMPKGANILSLNTQKNKPYIWAMVDTDNEPEKRSFFGMGTGHIVKPEAMIYIGTVLMNDDTFVFHVFEIPTN